MWVLRGGVHWVFLSPGSLCFFNLCTTPIGSFLSGKSMLGLLIMFLFFVGINYAKGRMMFRGWAGIQFRFGDPAAVTVLGLQNNPFARIFFFGSRKKEKGRGGGGAGGGGGGGGGSIRGDVSVNA